MSHIPLMNDNVYEDYMNFSKEEKYIRELLENLKKGYQKNQIEVQNQTILKLNCCKNSLII